MKDDLCPFLKDSLDSLVTKSPFFSKNLLAGSHLRELSKATCLFTSRTASNAAIKNFQFKMAIFREDNHIKNITIVNLIFLCIFGVRE